MSAVAHAHLIPLDILFFPIMQCTMQCLFGALSSVLWIVSFHLTIFKKSRNPANFHRQDGAGYQLLADTVLEVDVFNPQLSSQLVNPLLGWRRVSSGHLMRSTLESMPLDTISADLREKVTSALD